MPEPSKIPVVWASAGDYNDIPASDAGTGLASWGAGFPPETQTPIVAGGTPPRRQDMNGALNAVSKALLWYQQGGIFAYANNENYEIGNVALQNCALYYCIRPNGPAGTVISPAADSAGAYWRPIIYADGTHPAPSVVTPAAVTQVLQAVYPVGSIYCSYGITPPEVLFGFGSWTKIEGRFLLGANLSYGLGSTGGAATVALTVDQLPAHNHGASSASAGAHTHSITVNSGGAHTHTASSASAGAHTHTATTASAGAHTHTRGTMEITGNITSTDDDEFLIYADRLSASGAFTLGPVVSGRFIRGDYSGDVRQSFSFTASRSWTGATSSSGAHTHTLTTASAGAHTHSITVNSGGAHTHTASSASAGAHTHTITVNNTGGGKAHNNMPPYLAVNMWRRVA